MFACCVPGCSSNTATSPNLRMHGLPRGKERWKLWATLIGRPDITQKNLRKQRICSLHFESSYMRKNTVARKAIPTLYVPTSTQEIKRIVSASWLRHDDKTIKILPKPCVSEDDDTAIDLETQIQSSLLIRPHQSESEPESFDDQFIPGSQDSEFAEIQDETAELSDETTTFKAETIELSDDMTDLEDEPIEFTGSDVSQNEIIKVTEFDILQDKTTKIIEPEDETSISFRLKENDSTIDEELLEDEISEPIKEEFSKLKNIIKEAPTSGRYFKKVRLYNLNLYYHAPNSYKLFENYFSLPSEERLKNTKFNLGTGINKNFLKLVSKKIKKMPSNSKYVTLCFEEIPLLENVHYDIRNKEVVGYQDLDGSKNNKNIAKTALVLKIKGCFRIYEQLIAYGFSGSNYDLNTIFDWLVSIIKLLFELGIVVCVVVSNFTNFIKNLTSLKNVTPETPFFTVEGTKIFYIFDISQLITSLRNDLLAHDFLFDQYKFASWFHVKAFHENESLRIFKLAPKLTDAHIEPSFLQRDNVKLAKEVFSYVVAAGITADMESGLQTADALGTADFILKINDLYDLLSSTPTKYPQKYKKPFIGADYQKKYLISAYNMFSRIKAFNTSTKTETNEMHSFLGILITLQGILKLHEHFVEVVDDNTLFTRRLHHNLRKMVSDLVGETTPKTKSKMLTPIQLKRNFSKLALKQLLRNPVSHTKNDLDSMVRGTEGKYEDNDFTLLDEYLPNEPYWYW